MKLPLLGLGTYNLLGHDCIKVVQEALELGYRHIDTAHVYENHEAIRKGLKGFDRQKLFITSKFMLEDIDPKNVEDSVEATCDLALKQLGTDYLDLYLIHWPHRTWPLTQVFKSMEELVKKGKIKRAGVSNFTIHHLQDLLEEGCKPFANQVEFHPYLYQKELLDYCKLQHIQLIAYRPLGKGALLKDPVFKKIADRHEKTPTQVILRWLIQQEIPTVPKASSKEHLAENLAIFDFELTSAEMKEIAGLNKNHRYCKMDHAEFNY